MHPKIRWLFLLIILLTFSSCIADGTDEAIPYVNLNHLEPIQVPLKNEIHPLRVAVAAVISPQGSAESYAPLLKYISHELGRPVESVQRRTYTEVNELIQNGEVDMAFVCTSSYLLGERQFGMQLLAAPEVNGEVVYHAVIIVSEDSTIRSLNDLRGKIFAFTDPISFSGRMYPTYLLQEAEETPENFFERTFFTYSHDDAIYSVANGIADGASVDKLVLDFAVKRDPSLEKKIRVIHTSPPFGMPPVVVGSHIRPQLFASLQDILLNMHMDSEGRSALDTLDYDRFVPVSATEYETAKTVEAAVSEEP